MVVHELCHMHIRDHSGDFWNEVDKVMQAKLMNNPAASGRGIKIVLRPKGRGIKPELRNKNRN